MYFLAKNQPIYNNAVIYNHFTEFSDYNEREQIIRG